MQPLQIPIAFEGLRRKARKKAYAGGRGPAKSHSFARQLIINSENESCRILCCREIQKSIEQSVHHLIKSIILDSGRESLFDIQKQIITCRKTGSQFIFAGLRDLRSAEALKSIEDVKYCWLEEAQSISTDSWKVLDPTVRIDGSEIWASLNPRFDSDVMFSMFFDDGAPPTVKKDLPPSTIAKFVSWRDNPWFTTANYNSMCEDRLISEGDYLHTWEGHLQTAAGNLIKRSWLARYDPNEQRSYLLRFISADTAFSKGTTADFSVLGLWGVTRDNLDLLDVVRGRWDYPELLAAAKEFHERHTNLSADMVTGTGPMGAMVIEKKASGQSLIQSLQHEGFEVVGFDPGDRDKVTRTNASIPSIKFGRVRIPPDDYAPWVPTYVSEMCAFRDDMKHPHDDQVDMTTQAEYTWRQTIG